VWDILGNMSRTRLIARAFSILAFVLVHSSAAQAQMLDRGWYFEVALGKATFKDVSTADLDALTRDFFDSFELPVQTLSSTRDDYERSYALLSGYRFSPYLAFEAGLFRLGAVQYAAAGSVSDAGTLLPASFNFSYRAKGVLIGGTATLPLGEYFELRGRAGITNSETRVRYFATVDGVAASDHFSESSQDFYYGAGVGFWIGQYYRIGADFLHHDKFGKAGGNGSTDVDNILLSFTYEY
jgi:OmpA-OmpF porin, OOP family